MQTLTSAIAHPRVLIADDEPIIARTLALILQQNGFDAVCVLSGEAAIEVARAARPDTLIFDVYMSGISGIEAASRIRGLYPACRTILISGAHPTPELLAETAALGEDVEILIKPFTPEVLIDRLSAPLSPLPVPEKMPDRVLVASH